MGALVAIATLAIIFGASFSLANGVLTYLAGLDDRERETRWEILYGSDCYNNDFVVPFSYFYDLGYAAYDRRKVRAERNKERFKRK